jgi:phosphocarrier protein
MTCRGRRVNAKSIMGVMLLAAGQGSRLSLEVDGPDEIQAIQALHALIENKFGEAQ